MRVIPDFLPISPEGAQSVFAKNYTSKQSPSRSLQCNILVIDDDSSQQRLIQQTLASGANVLQEFSGVTNFVESLDFEDVDAVIIDYKMPDRNGLDVLKDVRTKYPELPVLFMTGFGDLEVAKSAIAHGANEYLTKPFEPADLRNVVSKWVTSYEPEQSEIPPISFSPENMGLDEHLEFENLFNAHDLKGNRLIGRVVRYNDCSVIVETPMSSKFPVGTDLKDTCITLGHRSMDIVGAKVFGVTDLVERRLIEVSLPGVWQIQGYKEGTEPKEVAEILRSRSKPPVPEYSRFDEGIRLREQIPETYRSTVSDIEHILQEFSADLEPFEKLLSEVSGDERAEIEARMTDYAEERFFPILSQAMGKFDAAAELAQQEGLKHDFRKFAQKRLFPHVLCAPFISRVISKPIGVPGDFGILGRLLGDPYEGHSLFGRMLNAWIITSNSSAAYRHRIKLLGESIDETVAKAINKGETAKILSMASGVAYEVQDFVKKSDSNQRADFELVDFSNRTLLEAEKHFENCRKISDPKDVKVTLRQGSVIDLAKQTLIKGDEGHEKYHMTYCAGLFDYLSSRMCSNIVSYLYDLTKPGGTLIVSNYTPGNAARHFMGVIMDWELIHRTAEEFESLMKTTSANGSFEIVEDDTGTEVYAIVRKK